MGNQQPTQEQIKEFWEWCGFQWKHLTCPQHTPELCHWAWVTPDGKECDKDFELPPPDLNHLFKYAVPKLKYLSLYTARDTNIKGIKPKRLYEVSIQLKFGAKPSNNINENLALALFWAIREATHG